MVSGGPPLAALVGSTVTMSRPPARGCEPVSAIVSGGPGGGAITKGALLDSDPSGFCALRRSTPGWERSEVVSVTWHCFEEAQVVGRALPFTSPVEPGEAVVNWNPLTCTTSGSAAPAVVLAGTRVTIATAVLRTTVA